MAFKMKAGKDGPMRKNFPSAFRKDKAKASQTKTNQNDLFVLQVQYIYWQPQTE